MSHAGHQSQTLALKAANGPIIKRRFISLTVNDVSDILRYATDAYRTVMHWSLCTPGLDVGTRGAVSRAIDVSRMHIDVRLNRFKPVVCVPDVPVKRYFMDYDAAKAFEREKWDVACFLERILLKTRGFGGARSRSNSRFV